MSAAPVNAPASEPVSQDGAVRRPHSALVPVPGNRWKDVDVPALEGWAPRLSVSVIIPAYNNQDALRLTLAGLASQTYPPHLLDVIVVDDGSEPAIELIDPPAGLSVSVMRQQRNGFGAGRARRLGAGAATGAILLFLDADMVLEPQAVAAHARWHHVLADATVLGRRRHVDVANLDPVDVSLCRSAHDLHALFADREQWPVEWIEDWLARTNELTDNRHDVFRITASGNLSVRADFAEEVGGFPAFGIRGIEDTTFGYRLGMNGALFVPDPLALGWHQGRSFFQGSGSEAAKADRASRLAAAIPLKGFRPVTRGRSYAVPAVTVLIDGTEAPTTELVATVEAVLASTWHDLVVEVRPPEDPVRSEAVRHHFDGDPRVDVLTAGSPFTRPSPVRVVVPPGALLGRSTVEKLVKEISAEGRGALHVTIPGVSPRAAMIEVRHLRALSRAVRLTDAPGAADGLAAELFGERWLGGSALDVRTLGTEPTAEDPAEVVPGEVGPAKDVPKRKGAKAGKSGGTSMPREEYLALGDLLGMHVERSIPGTSTVAMVTRGDDQFLGRALMSCGGGHFPQTKHGVWAGHHPASGQDAVHHLLELARRGFTHFLVPAPYAWWLEHYAELREFLHDHASEVFSDDRIGTLFALGPLPAPAPPEPEPTGQVEPETGHTRPEPSVATVQRAQPVLPPTSPHGRLKSVLRTTLNEVEERLGRATER